MRVSMSQDNTKIGVVIGKSLLGGPAIQWFIEPIMSGTAIKVTSVSMMSEDLIKPVLAAITQP